MIMEADSGGQILVTCLVSKVRAEEDVLHQLLCDLETITWGQGDSPRQVSPRMLASTMNHCRLAPESVAAWEAVVCLTRHGFMTSSKSCACAPQIEEILAGKRKRLQPQEGVRFTGR
jgi:hypothetical protein